MIQHSSLAEPRSNGSKDDRYATSSTLAPPVLDLCSGLGGLSLAARNLGMRIVAAVDTNAYALRTFAKNFPGATAINGSVCGNSAIAKCREALRLSKLRLSQLVIVSGPPCQGFSVAGPRDPSDKRNKVLLGVARAVIALQPKCALVENVAAIFRKTNSNRVSDFTRRLEAVGYHVMPLLLDAKDYGVPQRRKRAFFLIGQVNFDALDVHRRLENLKQPERSTGEALKNLPPAKIRPDFYDDELDIGTIPNHYAMQHSPEVIAKIAALAPGTGPMSYRRLHPDRPSNTLFSGHRAPPAHFALGRSITVREAARLQGFPDNFRVYGSFGGQMEQVTNAVPPPLAQAVLKVLADLAGLSST
jgi:DNA (cytosine-5)-methyltransferase 1